MCRMQEKIPKIGRTDDEYSARGENKPSPPFYNIGVDYFRSFQIKGELQKLNYMSTDVYNNGTVTVERPVQKFIVLVPKDT